MSEEMEKNLANEEAYYTGLHEGKLEGKLEGRLEGKIETQTLIVKNLLFNSIPDDIIIKSTNISKEELEKIKNEIK